LGSNCRKLEAIQRGDLNVIAGKRDKLLGRIQELYGLGKEEAEKQIKQWESSKKKRRGGPGGKKELAEILALSFEAAVGTKAWKRR
jgi:hypothetical protein